MTTFELNEAIVESVSRLVDDAGAPREPSHSDIESVLRTAGLLTADPHGDPSVRVGKRKRVRRVLSWSLDNDPAAGVRFVTSLVAMIRGCGGFRPVSPNYCGDGAIATCVEAFVGEPVELTTDGLLRPRRLDSLGGQELTQALRSYVVRAQRGHVDSVLVVGTDKDLMEAVAAHVLTERFGSYSAQENFPSSDKPLRPSGLSWTSMTQHKVGSMVPGQNSIPACITSESQSTAFGIVRGVGTADHSFRASRKLRRGRRRRPLV